jgi:hypothetical protein
MCIQELNNEMDWFFCIDRYKNEYDPSATWVNNWMEGGIVVNFNGIHHRWPLSHLLMEELEHFICWMARISAGKDVPPLFEFINSELTFHYVVDHSAQIFSLVYGFGDDPIRIDIIGDEIESHIECQMERLKETASEFPLRGSRLFAEGYP